MGSEAAAAIPIAEPPDAKPFVSGRGVQPSGVRAGDVLPLVVHVPTPAGATGNAQPPPLVQVFAPGAIASPVLHARVY